MKIRILLGIGAIFCVCNLLAQEQEDSLITEKRKPLLFGFPAAYYTPETEWGFGAGGVFNFYLNENDTVSPSSQIQLAVSYTLRKQVLVYLPLSFYWDEFKNVIESELGYYDFIYPYYGLGDGSLVSDREDYSSRYFRLRLDALRRVKGQTFVGLRYWLDTPEIYKVKNEGLLDLNSVLGKSGGVISGLGPQVRVDHRDNIYNPKSGYYINSFFQHFNKAIGSEFKYSRYRIDARKYWPAGKTTIASQFYSDINWGDVPFFQKARLGGTKILRGFLEGRFIDDASLVSQVELRRGIYKRRLGGVAFLGAGAVSSQINDILNSKWVYSGGLGLRYMIDTEKGINVRFDLAFTPEGSNFYLTIGEAF